jgi:predicted GIY-YIG superfamily endonuclease
MNKQILNAIKQHLKQHNIHENHNYTTNPNVLTLQITPQHATRITITPTAQIQVTDPHGGNHHPIPLEDPNSLQTLVTLIKHQTKTHTLAHNLQILHTEKQQKPTKQE